MPELDVAAHAEQHAPAALRRHLRRRGGGAAFEGLDVDDDGARVGLGEEGAVEVVEDVAVAPPLDRAA